MQDFEFSLADCRLGISQLFDFDGYHGAILHKPKHGCFKIEYQYFDRVWKKDFSRYAVGMPSNSTKKQIKHMLKTMAIGLQSGLYMHALSFEGQVYYQLGYSLEDARERLKESYPQTFKYAAPSTLERVTIKA